MCRDRATCRDQRLTHVDPRVCRVAWRTRVALTPRSPTGSIGHRGRSAPLDSTRTQCFHVSRGCVAFPGSAHHHHHHHHRRAPERRRLRVPVRSLPAPILPQRAARGGGPKRPGAVRSLPVPLHRRHSRSRVSRPGRGTRRPWGAAGSRAAHCRLFRVRLARCGLRVLFRLARCGLAHHKAHHRHPHPRSDLGWLFVTVASSVVGGVDLSGHPASMTGCRRRVVGRLRRPPIRFPPPLLPHPRRPGGGRLFVFWARSGPPTTCTCTTPRVPRSRRHPWRLSLGPGRPRLSPRADCCTCTCTTPARPRRRRPGPRS